MKIFGAIVAICLAGYLFYEAHDMQGMSLGRFGYIVGAVVLVAVTIFLFVPENRDEE